MNCNLVLNCFLTAILTFLFLSYIICLVFHSILENWLKRFFKFLIKIMRQQMHFINFYGYKGYKKVKKLWERERKDSPFVDIGILEILDLDRLLEIWNIQLISKFEVSFYWILWRREPFEYMVNNLWLQDSGSGLYSSFWGPYLIAFIHPYWFLIRLKHSPRPLHPVGELIILQEQRIWRYPSRNMSE